MPPRPQLRLQRHHPSLLAVFLPMPQQLLEDLGMRLRKILSLARVGAQVVELPVGDAFREGDEVGFPGPTADGGAAAEFPAEGIVRVVDAGGGAGEVFCHGFAAHGHDGAALEGRSRVFEAREVEQCGRDVHHGHEVVADTPWRHGAVIVQRWVADHAWDTHAAFGCVGFVEAGWRGCCLGPAGTVPDEGIFVADILEGIVVVLADVSHQLAGDHGICFVGGPFGSIVRHEHDEGVVQLAN